MFSYPQLSSVEVEGMRLYTTPTGNSYPSVTTMLGSTMADDKAKSLDAWRKSYGEERADEYTKVAADSGSAVHAMIERFLKKQDPIWPSTASPRDIGRFNAMKLLLKNITKVYGLEVALYSDELMLAGRTDCVGEYNGELSIIDFKTSNRLKKIKDVEDYNYQITAYAMMHNELFGTSIQQGVILMTSSEGFPQHFTVKTRKYEDRLRTRIGLFYERLERKLLNAEQDRLDPH